MQADLAETTTSLTILRSLGAHFLPVGLMDEESELDILIAKQQASGRVSRNIRSLPIHVLKSLAQDIEAAGGIGGRDSRRPFNLPRICNKREDIYGAPGSSRRKAIQNKVDRWRKLTRAEYSAVLEALNVRQIVPSAPSPLKPSSFEEEPPHPNQQSPPPKSTPKTAKSTPKSTTPGRRDIALVSSHTKMTPRSKFDDLDGNKFVKYRDKDIHMRYFLKQQFCFCSFRG